MYDNRQIGIIDSGVGGLTVAKEFRLLMPGEDILYLGDNKNVPYGRKTKEEIYALTKKMIDFLLEKDVKLIAVACNTISSILDTYFLDLQIPLVSIINPVVQYVYKKDLKKIALAATEFTIDSKIYEKHLHIKNKDMEIITESFPFLAEIIDRGDYGDEEVLKEIKFHMENILKKASVKDLILGCTHYPIVLEKFKEISPEINFINPAYEQTVYVKRLIEENNLSNNKEKSTFDIYTSGNKEVFIKLLETLSMDSIDNIYEIQGF